MGHFVRKYESALTGADFGVTPESISKQNRRSYCALRKGDMPTFD
jgi:hypothetical protein